MLTMVVPKLVHHYQKSPVQYGRQQKPPPGLTKEQKREWQATHQVHSALAVAVSGASHMGDTALRSEATDDNKRLGIGGRITSHWRQIQVRKIACMLLDIYIYISCLITSNILFLHSHMYLLVLRCSLIRML